MNVFVLCTGRSASTTFARACSHLEDFTVGHETKSHLIGEARFDYPDQHIEVDNRLTWFLGGLARRFDAADAFYVHLRRNPDDVVASFMRRWNSAFRASIISAFSHGIVMEQSDWSDAEQVCRFYVETVTDNLQHFLQDRPSMTFWVEEAETQFPAFISRIGARGDIAAAITEWRSMHNASD